MRLYGVSTFRNVARLLHGPRDYFAETGIMYRSPCITKPYRRNKRWKIYEFFQIAVISTARCQRSCDCFGDKSDVAGLNINETHFQSITF